jgi:glutamate racemase
VAKIVIFDSGFGSLSIIKPIQKAMKSDIIYFADQKNFPYGKKSKSQLTTIITKTIRLLEKKFEPDLIVMGSNTPSLLVSINKKNLVKVLPPIKKAVRISMTGNIAMLATNAVVRSKILSEYVRKNRLPKLVNLKKIDATRLVRLVEHGEFLKDKKLCERTIAKVLSEPFSRTHVDVAILSSTHLPFLLPYFKKQFPNITFVDPGKEVAEKVKKIVARKQSKKNTMKVFTSSEPKKFQKYLLQIGIKKNVSVLP